MPSTDALAENDGSPEMGGFEELLVGSVGH
jgi:hypothetical protein